MQVVHRGGIVLQDGLRRVILDPDRKTPGSIVSHGHMDHLTSGGVMTPETLEVLRARRGSGTGTELPYDRVVSGIRERADRPVSDVMQPIEAVLDADDHVMKAIYEMVTLDVSLLPVTELDRLVGVVRSVDVFHEVAKLL